MPSSFRSSGIALLELFFQPLIAFRMFGGVLAAIAVAFLCRGMRSVGRTCHRVTTWGSSRGQTLVEATDFAGALLRVRVGGISREPVGNAVN